MTKDEFTDLVGIEYADEYEKAQLSQEGTTFSYGHENDTISRQAAIDALDFEIVHMTAYCDGKNEGNPLAQYNKGLEDGKKAIKALSSAQPENQVHLCDSCRHVYPECPSEKEDVIFGNGKGNDNICACNKYEPSAQPEEAIPVSWIEARIAKFMMAGDAFSGLTASIIRVMLNEWKREQEGETDGQN